MKNGVGLKQASGPTGWWARKTGACTGMSLVVGAALTNTRSSQEPKGATMSIADRYALATRLARLGCAQKVEIPAEKSLFWSCDLNKGDFSELVTQHNATKVISEMSPVIIEHLVNPGSNPREVTLKSIQRVYKELKSGHPALLVLKSKTSSLPHTVLVTGIEGSTPEGMAPAVVLSVYDSNWDFEGPYWPKTSRVLIPFENDWSLPKTREMALIGFEQYMDPRGIELEEELHTYTIWDESRGMPSPGTCCALVRTYPSVFSTSDRTACEYREGPASDMGL
jgi:hypothetical protein